MEKDSWVCHRQFSYVCIAWYYYTIWVRAHCCTCRRLTRPVLFRIIGSLAVSILIRTLYILKFIQGIYSREREVFLIHYGFLLLCQATQLLLSRLHRTYNQNRTRAIRVGQKAIFKVQIRSLFPWLHKLKCSSLHFKLTYTAFVRFHMRWENHFNLLASNRGYTIPYKSFSILFVYIPAEPTKI